MFIGAVEILEFKMFKTTDEENFTIMLMKLIV